jgi:NifU-like protein involved in Fe-S cluster formation
MDETVATYYRKLMKIRFEHFGSLVKPSIFLDSSGEMIYLCGTGNEFMQLFLNVSENRITDIKYSCFCTPAANVAVEILCGLLKGKGLDEAEHLSEQALCESLGTDDPDFRKKSQGLLELLNRGIIRYREKNEKKSA